LPGVEVADLLYRAAAERSELVARVAERDEGVGIDAGRNLLR